MAAGHEEIHLCGVDGDRALEAIGKFVDEPLYGTDEMAEGPRRMGGGEHG
ncbi:hypothetical protein [Brevibacterium samyangense]|uniref:Uncharacterized protein n=1 Tax=Brevibacterium samyangense TaxID=366888 RepID=A0ABN2TBI0_9MICO